MKKPRLSLQTKVIAMILLVAVILSASAVIISYAVYANTMDEHYQTLAQNISKTAAEMLDAQEVRTLTGRVMDIFRTRCSGDTPPDFSTLSVEEVDAFYRESGIYELPEYQHCLDTLSALRDANNVKWMYICYMDLDTGSAVYILDVDGVENIADTIEDGNRHLIESGTYDFPAYITNYEDYGWLSTAASGIFDSSGNYVANAYVDISMDNIMADRQEFLIWLLIFLFAATTVLIVLIIWFIRRSIVKPINQLSRATSLFVNEKKDPQGVSAISQLQIHTKDEIEHLSDSIKTMEREINSYIDNLARVTGEKERISAELNVATQIQASMLPSTFPAFPEREEFDIYALMNPAKEVGGDFYDFFFVDDDHFAMVMADVSGKGVPAALFMVVAKNLIKNNAQTMPSPKDILEKVNQELCENNEAEMFVTVWLGILEISTGTLRAANAGHEYPILRRADGSFELYKDKHGFVLGGMPTAKYREYELPLQKGDKLYLYTDGVTEATNARNELYGTARLLAALNDNPQTPPSRLLPAIRADIDRFVQEAPQFDDITMMAFELKKGGSVSKKV